MRKHEPSFHRFERYKTTKCQENVDWESRQSKYKDIYEDFVRQYPQGRQDEFPHSNGEITSKAQITSKLKAVRTKYRKAVDTGKRSGQGRVVFIFFELCQQVWGGSPATETIAGGLETADCEDDDPAITRSSTPLSESQENVENENSGSSSGVVNSRRNMLQAKLDGHRREKLKRKLHSDSFVEEDLHIKRRMLDLAEEAEMNNVHRLPSGFSPHGFSTPGPMHHPSAVSTPRLSPSFHNPQQGQGPSYRRMLMREDTIEEQDFTY
uniref:MADF domain-containing protein n=1 Tax=Knipowitschia caucasica TaxID=637954 RepID=A0AAV2K0W3_KNICA